MLRKPRQRRYGRENMTQDELAALTDVSTQYISLVETGKKKASLKIVVAIAQSLSVSLDELVFGMGKTAYSGTEEMDHVLEDLTRYEEIILSETMEALKRALRTYKKLQ